MNFQKKYLKYKTKHNNMLVNMYGSGIPTPVHRNTIVVLKRGDVVFLDSGIYDPDKKAWYYSVTPTCKPNNPAVTMTMDDIAKFKGLLEKYGTNIWTGRISEDRIKTIYANSPRFSYKAKLPSGKIIDIHNKYYDTEINQWVYSIKSEDSTGGGKLQEVQLSKYTVPAKQRDKNESEYLIPESELQEVMPPQSEHDIGEVVEINYFNKPGTATIFGKFHSRVWQYDAIFVGEDKLPMYVRLLD
jgi:hypothetical protein